MQQESSDYSVIRTLRKGVTHLARYPLGRLVVLKKLPDDCLHRGRLHDSVRDRLERLREAPVLPFVGPAAVERRPDGVMLVSPFVAGNAFVECDPAARAAAAAPLRRAVAALHARGLAHGAIHGNNVIVGEHGVTLIDASPFLHDDFAVDLAAVDRLIGAAPSVMSSPSTERAWSSAHIAAAIVVTLFAVAGAIGWIAWEALKPRR